MIRGPRDGVGERVMEGTTNSEFGIRNRPRTPVPQAVRPCTRVTLPVVGIEISGTAESPGFRLATAIGLCTDPGQILGWRFP